MKKLLLTLAALTLLVSGAFAENNEIGIYTTQDANPDNAVYNGAPGSFFAYVVLTTPFNDHTGSAIMSVGGFEFRLEIPAGVFLLSNTLPANSTNFASPPNFFVGTNIPVVDGRCTLATLQLGNFTGAPGSIFMGPVPNIASIPDAIAITDAADGFSISQAFPVSGSFDAPVFGMWTSVVPTEDASWSELQTLFR